MTRWLAVLLLAGSAHPAFAAIRPSFGLDDSAWRSTDIVKARAVNFDGDFEVLETWKGRLTPGEHVLVRQFKPPVDAASTLRIVMFLKRTERGTWAPANVFDDFKTSAFWIDGAQLFYFIQTMNPGPTTFQRWANTSESSVRDRVAEIVRTQGDMNAVVRIDDGAQRARALKPYLRSELWPARIAAQAEIAKCGSDAVPVIDSILDDPSFAMESGEMIKALATAGGAAVGADLAARFKRDLEFWRRVGPALREGWWNEDPTPQSPLRNRYMQTIELIRALDKIHFPDALPTAVTLRDFWRSLPHLNDPTGLNALATECDDLIRHLQ